jgi:NADH dehydrogenase
MGRSMSSKQIVVIGGGFAGLWSALSAARELDRLAIGPDKVGVTLVNRDAWHGIRVRNYESDISDARVPLADVLGPASVKLVVGEVSAIDVGQRKVTIAGDGKTYPISFDRLVIAAGSLLSRPAIPGLTEHAFSIDTWDDAAALDAHLRALSLEATSREASSVLIVGAGLTGIELACEMPERLRALGVMGARVILADRNRAIGSDMGDHARPSIEKALHELGVETRTNTSIVSIDDEGVVLGDGSRIASKTVVWTAGLVASPLAKMVLAALDDSGRIVVDACLRVPGVEGLFAAGDIAAAPIMDGHFTVMSCQHARPMGRFAGHNAVCDLLGREMLEMSINYYVTCLDLGPWGALYTKGWDRHVTAAGPDVKQTKTTTNRVRIYPPRTGDRRELLDASSPMVQMAPAISGGR